MHRLLSVYRYMFDILHVLGLALSVCSGVSTDGILLKECAVELAVRLLCNVDGWSEGGFAMDTGG